MEGARPTLKQSFLDCAAGVGPACEDAFAQVRPAVEKVIRRLSFQFGLPGESEDLVQHVLVTLLEDLPQLAHQLPEEEPPLVAYLSISAANTARDWFRARGAMKRGARVTRSLEADRQSLAELIPGQSLDVERKILLDQIENMVSGEARDLLIFRLHYRQRYTAARIASIPALNLTVKGVEAVLTRLRKQIRVAMNVEGKADGKASS